MGPIKIKGFSLLELVIGLTLLAVLTGLSLNGFSSLFNQQQKQTKAIQESTDEQLLNLFLRNRLNGTKGFSNLYFHVPGQANNFQSIGPGIFVSQTEDPVSHQLKDTIYIVSKNSQRGELPNLGSLQLPSGIINGVSGNLPLGSFTDREYHIISKIQRSDMALVTVAGNANPDGTFKYSYSTNSNTEIQSPTYYFNSAPNFQQIYASGDSVTRADITKISLDDKGNLTKTDLASDLTQQIGAGTTLNQFTVEYMSHTPKAPCGNMATNNNYSHDWSQVNNITSIPGVCYQYINSLRINYTLQSGRPYSYEFKVN
jgi:prepilin-type N-terminal cleavage/methylation domain-containing protein